MILVLQGGKLECGGGGRDTSDCPSDRGQTQEQTPALPHPSPASFPSSCGSVAALQRTVLLKSPVQMLK